MGIINKMEALIGNTFKTENGTISLEQLQASCDVIAIYFSAHWCPPCRGFTPVFAEKYKKLLAAGKKFECIFASSDRDVSSFTEYYNEMQIKETLATKYGCRGIPMLVILDGKTGEVIT